jgi:hypothetical protein
MSQGFRSALTMSDGESAVRKLRTELDHMGIEIEVYGAGGHVARVERRLRTVKERMRCYVSHHLPCAHRGR